MDIPLTTGKQKRVVIVGAGFAGLKLARLLSAKYFQVVLLDKNNYHQFQPLLYDILRLPGTRAWCRNKFLWQQQLAKSWLSHEIGFGCFTYKKYAPSEL